MGMYGLSAVEPSFQPGDGNGAAPVFASVTLVDNWIAARFAG
jgi:hypothetical protein